jgi:hypothetical protein
MNWLGPQGTVAVVGALVGGVIAIAGGLFTQLFVMSRQRARLRRNLLIALESEVTVLLSLLAQAWQLRDRADEAHIVGSHWVTPWTTLHSTHVGVYGKAASDLGLLPSSLVPTIVSFYGQVVALQEFVTYAEETPQHRTWTPEFKAVLTAEIGRRYRQVWGEGTHLLEQFRSNRSWLEWWPLWRRAAAAKPTAETTETNGG